MIPYQSYIRDAKHTLSTLWLSAPLWLGTPLWLGAPLGLSAQPRFTGVFWRTSFLETADFPNLDFKKKVSPLCDEMHFVFDCWICYWL